MADSFNLNDARARQDEIIREVQYLRDGINKDVIDYYFDKHPQSEDEEKQHKADMRKYLGIAADRIRELLNGKLY